MHAPNGQLKFLLLLMNESQISRHCSLFFLFLNPLLGPSSLIFPSCFLLSISPYDISLPPPLFLLSHSLLIHTYITLSQSNPITHKGTCILHARLDSSDKNQTLEPRTISYLLLLLLLLQTYMDIMSLLQRYNATILHYYVAIPALI